MAYVKVGAKKGRLYFRIDGDGGSYVHATAPVTGTFADCALNATYLLEAVQVMPETFEWRTTPDAAISCEFRAPGFRHVVMQMRV